MPGRVHREVRLDADGHLQAKRCFELAFGQMPTRVHRALQRHPQALRRGVQRHLGAGALPTLHDRCGISTEVLTQRIKGWLG